MHGSHQLVINSNKLESNSNQSTNSLYLSWYRATFSIVLTTCLSFVCLSAPSAETALPFLFPPLPESAADFLLTGSEIDLFSYCTKGNYKKLQSLLNKKPKHLDLNKLGYGSEINLNIVGISNLPYRKSTALMIASRRGDLGIVQVLLKAGADPSKTDYYNGTALVCAASNGHLSIVQALLKAGADSNKTDYFNQTALAKAAYFGHIDIVQALLKAGADPSRVINYDRTALIFAANFGVRFVVLGSPDPTSYRYTARHAAKNNRRLKIVQELFKAEIASHKDTISNETALISAILLGRIDEMCTLLKAGVDPNKVVYHGQTPLMFALLNENPKVIRTLLEAGADPNKVDQDGQTPLMFAVLLHINPKVIRTLLEAGADPNKVSHLGYSALTMIKNRKIG